MSLASSKNLKFCYGGYDVINDKGPVRRILPQYRQLYISKVVVKIRNKHANDFNIRNFLTDNQLI